MTGTLEAEARAQGVELDPLLREVNASAPVFWKRAKRVSIATMRLLGGSSVILLRRPACVPGSSPASR